MPNAHTDILLLSFVKKKKEKKRKFKIFSFCLMFNFITNYKRKINRKFVKPSSPQQVANYRLSYIGISKSWNKFGEKPLYIFYWV